LRVQLAIKNPILQAFGLQPLEFEDIFRETLDQYGRLKSCVRESFGLLQQILAAGGHVLLEGAQGSLLDNNWGTYPYCTASTTLAGGACAGLGIAPRWIERVVGVTKAYTTRVGAGPMPSELLDETGHLLQEAGKEFGTVTGRARRCGWFDAELVRFTSQLNGVTDLALTKLDVLDDLAEISICNGYHLPGEGDRLWRYWELDAEQLQVCMPVNIKMAGWKRSTSGMKRFEQLPSQAQDYVRKIEELTDTPVRYVSVGPERDATIIV
jgi:adenylosuccinate synthase